MRISAKGRYGLAALIHMAQNYESGEYVTVISISEVLGISKIYLEQVFFLLKRGGLVTSIKGAQGGYLLTRMPQKITVYDIMSALELSLFEKADEAASKKAPEIDAALNSVFGCLDETLKLALQKTTLYDLVYETNKHKSDQGLMFFI